MKFIINSDYFKKRLAKALLQGSTRWEESGDYIRFFSSLHNDVIEMQVHPLERSVQSEPFDEMKWQRVFSLLISMPEQPITVELSYNKIEIYCVMVFYITDQL
jgi:hypothetical protein